LEEGWLTTDVHFTYCGLTMSFQLRRKQLIRQLETAVEPLRTSVLIDLDHLDAEEENSLDEILDLANAIVSFADCHSPGYIEESQWREVCYRADHIIEAACSRTQVADA
jgi:hypothetical protein